MLIVSEARGTGGVDSASTGGTWDISNADRIGKGEVQLCNILIEGAAKLVKWENMMETGQGAAAEKAILELAGPQYPPSGLSGAGREEKVLVGFRGLDSGLRLFARGSLTRRGEGSVSDRAGFFVRLLFWMLAEVARSAEVAGLDPGWLR